MSFKRGSLLLGYYFFSSFLSLSVCDDPERRKQERKEWAGILELGLFDLGEISLFGCGCCYSILIPSVF